MDKLVRERIQFVLNQKGASIYSISSTENERVKMSRQINQTTQIASETVERVLEAFPDVSADYILRGEGPWERTKIVTPPTHRQDIHVEQGATAAISQSGTASATPAPATADEKKSDTFTYEDVARMVRDNDLGGLVGIIFAQQQTIIRYEQQRNADLLREISMVDSKLFPEPK